MKQLHQLVRGQVYINSTGTKFGFSDYPTVDGKRYLAFKRTKTLRLTRGSRFININGWLMLINKAFKGSSFIYI